MAEESFDNLDNLDDLDWSDVEAELKTSRDHILTSSSSSSASSKTATSDSAADQIDIQFLLDVQLELVVEVGKTSMLIEDLLKLAPDSVVELKSLLGHPLNISVNGNPVAHGEVVVINEKFGVRITDILSPKERFASLQA